MTGTSGAAPGTVYELTGPGEGQLKQYVGRRVEIIGKIKSGHAAGHTGAAASGSTTGATTGTQSGTTTGTQSGTATGGVAGATRSGSDIMGQDLNIPELEVVSVREATGSCPAAPTVR
jgi:hypothetical protein